MILGPTTGKRIAVAEGATDIAARTSAAVMAAATNSSREHGRIRLLKSYLI